MLRSLGIPTRMVSGYRGGEWSDATQAYTVRGSMAHLWMEAYFTNVGWVRFDPTPPTVSQPPQGVMGLLQRINDYQLRAKMFWFREIISFDRGLQWERLRALPQGIFSMFGFSADMPGESSGVQVGWMTTLAFLLAPLTLAGLVLYRRAQVKGPVLTPDQQRAVKLYRRMQRSLRKAGIDITGLTAEELKVEAAKLEWENPGDIDALLERYNEVRFGNRKLEQSQFRELFARLGALRPGRA